MTVSLNITDTYVFTALRTYLLSLAPPGAEVIQGQDNLVPSPVDASVGAFATMTSSSMVRQDTTITNYQPLVGSGQKTVLSPTRYTIQVDIYGPLSQAWAVQVSSLFRNEYAVDLFPADVQPLYADDPVQMPLINGEEIYEQRWKIQASMQYNPVLTISQDFATSLSATVIEVDAFSKPQ